MINYSPNSITITNEGDSDCEPLVLPADSTPAEVEAAAIAYLKIQPEPPPDPLASLTPEQKAALLALLQQDA